MPDSRYRPQLDALRAFAILGVLYTHLYDLYSPLGILGVRLFFVISGFLITGILLRLRDARSTSLGGALKTFFVRRGLRIYPAYYVLLAILAILNVEQIRAVLGYHLLFLSNILFIQRGDYVPQFVAPFWSLSIEEQFYLLWPFVILLTPRRFLTPAVVSTIVVGLGYRLISWRVGASGLTQYIATPAALDALGAGSLLALAGTRGLTSRSVRTAGVFGLVLALSIYLGRIWTHTLYRVTFSELVDTLVLLPMVALVAATMQGIRGWAGKLLETRPLVFLGRISYGVYLYHSSMWTLLATYGVRIRPSLGDRTRTMLVLGSALSIALATVSWFVLEQPVNRLKSRFPYPSANKLRTPLPERVGVAR